MTTYSILSQQAHFSLKQKQQHNLLSHYTLKWRQKQLLVKLSPRFKQPYVPLPESEQWLVDRLKKSPVRLVRIDPVVGERGLKFWADACKQARKSVFLELPSTYELPRKKSPLVGRLSG